VDGGDPVVVRARGRAVQATVVVGDGPETLVSGYECSSTSFRARVDGVDRTYTTARDGEVLWIGRDGCAWAVREQAPTDAVAGEAAGAGGPVRSPMPGTVTVVEVAEGQVVAAGDRLVVVEAMKMEHVLTAPVDGTVRGLAARAGTTVARDAVLLTVEPSEGA
jgi:acetyl-CoA/propionyl-CoA carboxylase biotin carboxyl carrier protein